MVHLLEQDCGELDAAQLAELASDAKRGAKAVPGYSVHVIEATAQRV